MLAQTLPSTAANYAAEQRLEQKAAIAAVLRQWSRMGVDFDNSWARIAPTVTAIVSTAQARVIGQSVAYVPAVLEETGQTAAIASAYQINQSALVGVTGSGIATSDVLVGATINAKTAIKGGSTVFEALAGAGEWLSGTVGTVLSDTGRAAEGLGMNIRPVGGYVRMLNPPSCGRCVVLAGKFYRKNAGFERHPECDCRHIPVSEAIAGDITISPSDYFDSLDEAGQAKLAGSLANAKAIRDGADIGQIINAYRKTAGLDFAQSSPIKRTRFGDKFTTEGTTRRGLAGQQQAGLRRNGPSQVRLMPESIYRTAPNHAEAIRLLKLYGWISDNDARSRGRDLLTEQRRVERNARARSRRAA